MLNFHLSIKNKIFILFITVIIISISAVGWFGFKSSKESYISSALLINKGETKALSNEIKGVLGTIPDDVIYNANFYALKKLLVWEDLKERKKIDQWKKQYLITLKDYIYNKKLYYQVRILDIKGNEKILLKYDENTNTIIQTPNEKLQNKSGKDYFNQALKLQKGEFYISEMNLNVEHGQIEKPYVPVVRYSTPIVDENGETKGVIVLNFNANIILEEIANTRALDNRRDVQKYYLINQNGYYLFAGDKSKRWGFQLGTDYNFKKDYKGVIENFKDRDEITLRENGKIYSMHKIYPNKTNNKYRFWYLVTVIDESVALASLNNFINIFAAILVSVLLFGLFIINGFVSRFMNPLTSITKQLKALSLGEIRKDDIKYSSNDEIGDIVNSTTILVDAIETTIKQANAVASGDFSQEIKLLSNNDSLGLALQDMTKRLKEITTLAQNLSVGNYDIDVVAKSSEDELGLALIDMIKYLESITLVAESIAIGDIDIKYQAADSNDRLGNAILQMIKYLKTILKQAASITNEDFSSNIEIKGKSDGLGIALVTMTDILRENSQKNKSEIWLSEGLGGFSDKLSGIDNVSNLAREAISICSRYVNAASGTVYKLDDDNETLSLISSFAFSSRDNLSNKFKMGEGIVGQVALEKDFILLKNVDSDDFKIQSGTTLSKPKEVFAVPLIREDEIYGVMELMSFEGFSDLQKNYLLKCANILTTALYTVTQNMQIKELLEQSRKAFEELQVKSEELEAQSEELKSSNEQMETQQQQLQEQSENLKIKNMEIEKAKGEIDKKADDLEASNQYKSEFLANMSHELRTPLNSVILLSSLLTKNSKQNLNDSDIQKAKVINESGNELLRLINDILDLSKIESGKMELIVDKIDTEKLSKHYTELFGHTAQDQGLDFEVIDNIKGSFYNDKDRLGQVIRNLISNAFKFTKEGGVTLKIDKVDDDKLPIKISVIDTGLGIAKEKQDLIFKAFTQADGSTSREFGGTGLGLSISKELAHLMGGSIELESQERKGSTFTLNLPSLDEKFCDDKRSNCEVKVHPIQSSDAILNKKDNIPQKKEQFLIIEDDKNFANVLKSTVEEHGANAYVAYNGEDGLKLANQHKIDGAIVDIGLPGISGIEVIKQLKSNPLTKNIHIQVISGLDENKENLDGINIEGYLQKPVSSEQINNVIKSIESAGDSSARSVLIVEDDQLHLKAIKDYISEENNYDIYTASTLSDAMRFCNEKYFDIAIVDLGLSDGNGMEICRCFSENKKDTSILIYTGRDLSNEEADYLNNISDEIIIKNPQSHERLKDEVDRFLNSPKTTVNDKYLKVLKQSEYNQNDINNLKDKKVLVVDDDIKNIFVLSAALQEHDMDVVHAKNGQEALDILGKDKDIDIVLMDIMMSVMNGFEAIKAIRADKELKHLPVIAVTAKAMKKDKDEAIAAGADDYLTKPIDLEKLTALISMWINK